MYYLKTPRSLCLPCDLLEMKIKMGHRIMEHFFESHEFVEVGVPFCRVIHAFLPLVVPNRIQLFRQREMGLVIDIPDPFVSKYFSLPACTKRIDPVERTRERVQ